MTLTFQGTESDLRKQKAEFEKTLEVGKFYSVVRQTTTYGPFRLRRTAGFLSDTWVEKETSQQGKNFNASIEGARISFSDNFDLDGNDALSTEGALIWPIHFLSEPTGTSTYLTHISLATSWRIEEQEKPDTSDINELKFSMPLGVLMQAPWIPGADPQVLGMLEPYYLTDTKFDGEIYGITTSFQYRNNIFGRYIPLTQLGARNLDVRFRGFGLMDYSDITEQKLDGVALEPALCFGPFLYRQPLVTPVDR